MLKKTFAASAVLTVLAPVAFAASTPAPAYEVRHVLVGRVQAPVYVPNPNATTPARPYALTGRAEASPTRLEPVFVGSRIAGFRQVDVRTDDRR